MPAPITVTLNGHDYSSSQFPGYGYLQAHPVTGMQIFPDSIFYDMLAQIASATTVQSVSPGAAGGYLRSNGTAWVRVSGVAAADVTAGTFGAGAYVFPSSVTATSVTVNAGAGVAAMNFQDAAVTKWYTYLDGSNQWTVYEAGRNPRLVINRVGAAGSGPVVIDNGSLSAAVVIVGTDPGTSALLRVGGTAMFSGTVTTSGAMVAASGFGLPSANVAGDRNFLSGENTNTGTTGKASVYIQNSIGTLYLIIHGSGFSSTGMQNANAGMIRSDVAGGLDVGCTHGAGDLRLWSRGALGLTIGNGQLATFTAGISAAGLPTSAGASGTLYVDGLGYVKRA